MTTLNLQVSADSDDCVRNYGGTAAFTHAHPLCRAGDFTISFYDYESGFRFTGAVMDSENVIISATIQFRANGISGGIPETFLECETADDTVTFVDAADYDARSRTSAISWTPPAWVTDTWYTSSELKTILQIVVDRVGYAGGSVVFFWRDASGWGGSTKRPAAYAHDGDAGSAAKLDIDYTPTIPPWTGYSQGGIII